MVEKLFLKVKNKKLISISYLRKKFDFIKELYYKFLVLISFKLFLKLSNANKSNVYLASEIGKL